MGRRLRTRGSLRPGVLEHPYEQSANIGINTAYEDALVAPIGG
ncbi:hypothetical protein [Nostoc flagelliforme]|nr:hypothetical protein [Nostoc flagelliforme]